MVLIAEKRLLLIFYIITALLATNIVLNISNYRFDIRDFDNTTATDTRTIIDILKFRYGVENHFRTNYAWDFNAGQKLDRLEADMDLVKEKLGLAENFTYAGPNR